MIRLIDFINSYSQQLQIAGFVLILFISWNIENVFGLILGYKKWKHAFVNAPFALTNLPGQILLGLAFVKTIGWTGNHQFGLLYFFSLQKQTILLFVVAFILLDLGEYVYHIIMHKVKRLWMFHAVHHSDTVVDVTTTFREHPGENVVRLSFTLLWVFLTGIPFWALIIRQLIQVVSNTLAHINYRLPSKTDKVLGLVFITPNLHHVHHHYKRPYTDCNYGDVLSIWDHIFGTYAAFPETPIQYGVDTYMDEKENGKFNMLIKLPFGKYRRIDYEKKEDESNN